MVYTVVSHYSIKVSLLLYWIIQTVNCNSHLLSKAPSIKNTLNLTIQQIEYKNIIQQDLLSKENTIAN